MSNKIKSILFISAFGKVTEEYSNDRVCTLYDNFETENKSIVITDFDHLKKSKRSGNFELRNAHYLPVPQYKSNISLGRIISHWIFAFRLKGYLNALEHKPDVIYCLVPTPSSCLIAGQFAKKHGIFFVTDVIDVWPDGLFTVNPKFTKILRYSLFPWKFLMLNSLSRSNLIFTANTSYKNWVQLNLKANKKIRIESKLLGINHLSNSFDFKNEEFSNEIRICYGGNLGKGYDFEAMFDAVDYVARRIKNKITFILVGGGDLEADLRSLSPQYNSFTTIITGKVDYVTYLKLLSTCQIGFNIFKSNQLVSMSYKIYDYFSCGLYVFNNLFGDASNIIEKYKIGTNVSCDQLGISLLDFINGSIEVDEKNYRQVLLDYSTKNIINEIEEIINYEKNKI